MLRRTLCVLGLLVLALTGVPAVAADAATSPKGLVSSAVHNTFTHRVLVRGWAADPAKPVASIVVRVYVAGRYVGRVRADRPSPRNNQRFGVVGRHAYAFSITRYGPVGTVTVRTFGAGRDTLTTLGRRAGTTYSPGPGERIVAVAKRYVGNTPYVEGGASPRSGFDCSGYTMWAYGRAHVRSLPHNAEAQRTMRGMRRISASQARPGDLVFYLGGGGAFHVAVYAGHHMQYSAATSRDGIRYQPVWSNAVQYRTDWH